MHRSVGMWVSHALRLVMALALTAGVTAAVPERPHAQATAVKVAVPAAPEVTRDVTRLVEAARQRFEARDAGGVLAHVSEQYRSAGFTKGAVRQQLLTIFSLYQEVRARVRVERVDVVEGATWVYTTGEVLGRLPLMGWVSVLSWEREPEVVRREPAGWRLIGFQD